MAVKWDNATLLKKFCVSATQVHVDIAVDDDDDGAPDSWIRLNTHANMLVIGNNAYILRAHDRTGEVSPYTPNYEPLHVLMMDAAVKYECPFGGKKYVLVVQNALHVPSMKHNLMRPFTMREDGLLVKDTTTIQMVGPTVEDHVLRVLETGHRVPLYFWSVFSYLPTTKPTKDEVDGTEDVYMLTTPQGNPHSDAYAKIEEEILD